MESSLNLFHPLIKEWFSQKYASTTDIQEKTWPEVASGKNVLVTAPTGSGKTLTAFLWAINSLVTGVYETGKLSVLYISPLKALNNDIQKNLLTPLEELDAFFKKNDASFKKIRVLTRSGDTPDEERRAIARNPPEILITTPESLNIILTSKNNRNMMKTLKCVILDEIHSIAAEKRGTYLITAVERLTLLCGEFQRISLSATVRPLDKIAEFTGGYAMTGGKANPIYEKREVRIIRSDYKKTYDVTVRYPDFEVENFDDEPVWLNLAKEFKKIIEKNKSTLFFANSRRFVEKMTRLINETEETQIAYSHHGSLSRELRLSVEQRLKEGKLKSIIATNSLELGIDIGQLDKVVLIQTPFKISSAIQRIGRAGHRIGEVSVSDIYPLYGKDFIYAAITSKCIEDFDIEEINPVENPLDILSQVLMSMTTVDRWDIDELFNFLKTSYPFRNLPRRQYDLVIDMLSGKYADSRIRELSPRIYTDKLENTVTAKEGTAFLLFMSGGTIPDRGTYDIRLKDSKAKIGELDEEFVWERRLGDAFPLGNQIWRIQQITHNDVFVTTEDRAINIIPFWKAEEQNRDFYFSEKIGGFLERMDGLSGDEGLKSILEKEYHMDAVSSKLLIEYLELQRLSINTGLPHRHHIVIENYDDPANKNDNCQVIMHTFWGGKVNKPFVIALSAFWENKFGYPLQYYADNDCILLSLPHEFPAEEILSFIKSENIESFLRLKLESTGYFGSRFRENAGRSLLLPKMSFKKRMPLWLNRLRSKKLLDAVMKYKDFPIMIETWRTCLQDDFDLENLHLVMDEIQQGRIKISSVVTAKPSPFSDNIIWRQTNKLVYEDDTPVSGKSSGLQADLIKEILYSPHLRPEIPAAIIKDLDGKLKRTAPGYAPDSYNELLSWINERKLIPLTEWKELSDSIRHEAPEEYDGIMEAVKTKAVRIKISGRSSEFVVSIENLPYIAKVFEFDPASTEYADIDGLSLETRGILALLKKLNTSYESDEEKDYLYEFFSDWLSYYCTILPEELKDIFGMDNAAFSPLTESLLENEAIVIDKISEKSPSDEICTVENLERLLRMMRSSRRVGFEPVPVEKLQLFLASLHGLTDRGESIEALQERIEKLFYYPAPVNSWEEYIFTSRMNVYYKSWLDNLTVDFNLLWLGSGGKRISPLFSDDIIFCGEENTGAEADIIDRLFRDKKAKYNFYDILSYSGLSSSELAETLWEQTWKGVVGNDSFDSFRKGYQNGFSAESPASEDKGTMRKISFNRWKTSRPDSGNWFVIDYKTTGTADPLEYEELKKEKARLLFKRYGIIFRQILENELPSFSWKEMLRSLRLMELSGEILTGYFFAGIPGIQFISFDAYRLLQGKLREDQVYWINAADPVSLCGIKVDEIKNNLPQRSSSTIIVFHGSKKVMISRSTFKKVDIFVPPDDPLLLEYFSFFNIHLTRQFEPVKKIFVEEINGENSIKSAYAEAFRNFGFKTHYKGLELWKSY